MSPHISYGDIVLLADLTSRILVRLRNVPREDNGLPRQVSDLLTSQRKLQERAADPADPINEHYIRQDRAALVGGCWKLVNDLDIALEQPNGSSNVEAIDSNKVGSLLYDYTLAIHQFLVTTSSNTYVEINTQLDSNGGALDMIRPIINSLVPTLIARAISEDLSPCSYVGDSNYVLAELKATIPDFKMEKHSNEILAYMLELKRGNTQKVRTNTGDATQNSDSSTARGGGGFGFTPSDPMFVFQKFMKEEGSSSSTQELDPPPPTGQAAEDADVELHRIYETLRDYQAQYQEFVDYPPCDVKAREKQAQILKDCLERNVEGELDKLVLGENRKLRGFKKYLTDETEDMLTIIDNIKSKGPGCRKRSRAY